MSTDMLWTLLTIIGIDIILGGDNAIIVAMVCRHLPPHLRNKAIFMGIFFAVLARGFLTIIAVYLLAIPYLMPIGGVFLIWIAFRLIQTEDNHSLSGNHYSISDAIKTIVIADVVMGFDNVIAVAGAAKGNSTLVIAGLLISVPIIVWGSKVILWAMKKVPIIIYVGAGILLYTAGHMILHETAIVNLLEKSFLPVSLFIPLLITAGLVIAWLNHKIRGIYVLYFPIGKK